MIAAVVQARTGSSRLPGKVLEPILGQPMLARQIERILRAESIDRVVIATSTHPSDDAVAALRGQCGVSVHRGALDDVLDRVCGAAAEVRAEHVVRLTGDCPLTDPAVVDRVVEAHLRTNADYTSNTVVRTYPDGLDVEVVRFTALAEARDEARLPSEREHVTPFIYRQPERYRLHAVTRSPDLSRLRWVVDVPPDLEIVRQVFARLYPQDPAFGMEDVLEIARREPGLFDLNANIDPEEGWRRSLQRDVEFLRAEEQQ